MLNLSLNELKQIAKMRRITGYKRMSKERLLSVLCESAENEKNFDNERLKMIRKDCNKLRYEFSKPEIKEIRKNLYEIESKKNLSKPKIKEIKENLNELEESLSRFKKFRNDDDDDDDDDDAEYRGIRGIGNLFNSQPTKIITNQKNY